MHRECSSWHNRPWQAPSSRARITAAISSLHATPPIAAAPLPMGQHPGQYLPCAVILCCRSVGGGPCAVGTAPAAAQAAAAVRGGWGRQAWPPFLSRPLAQQRQRRLAVAPRPTRCCSSRLGQRHSLRADDTQVSRRSAQVRWCWWRLCRCVFWCRHRCGTMKAKCVGCLVVQTQVQPPCASWEGCIHLTCPAWNACWHQTQGVMFVCRAVVLCSAWRWPCSPTGAGRAGRW